MTNIYEKSVFEFKSEITVSSFGSGFNTLIATDDLNPNLQLLFEGTIGSHILIDWSDSTGTTGTLTEEISENLTYGHFMVEYPAIMDSENSNRLKILMKDKHITENPNTVTVTVTFYASIKPGQIDNLLKDSPLEHTTYFNIDNADINTAAPAKMKPEKLQKFDLLVLGFPLTIDKKQNINFNAMFLFNGFTDKTLMDSNLSYKLTISKLPEIDFSTIGISVIDSTTKDTIPFTFISTDNSAIQININYVDAKGKTVLVSIPTITEKSIELPSIKGPLYIPCTGQLLDSSLTPTEIDFSNTNAEVTLISNPKTLSGGVKVLV